MKKHRLKNYLKFGILLFGVSLILTSCQKDDDFQQISKQEQLSKNKIPFEFKKKSFAELNNEPKFVNAITNVLNKGKTNYNLAAKTVMEDQYGFTIDSTLIKEISSDSYTSYTFFIHREIKDESFFENLVVTIDSSSIPKAYILKYNLNSQPVYVSEDDAYSLNADMELTQIDYNDTQAKISYQDGCSIVTLMCPYGSYNHPAGQACLDAERGDLYWETDNSNCYDNPNDSGTSVGGSSGGNTSGGHGNGDGSTGSSGSSGSSCRGCEPLDPIMTDPINDGEINSNDPCEKVNQLFEDFPDYKDELLDLATKTSETVEHGIYIDNASSNVHDGPTGTDGKFNLTNNPTNSYITVAHTHNSPATSTYSVFSWDDLSWIKKGIDNGKIKVSKFVLFLITADGTSYAITINDPTKLQNFFYHLPTTQGATIDIPRLLKMEKIRQDFYDGNNAKIKESNTDNDADRNALLEMIRDNDIGLDLFEVDANFEIFEKLTLEQNNTDVTKENCND